MEKTKLNKNRSLFLKHSHSSEWVRDQMSKSENKTKTMHQSINSLATKNQKRKSKYKPITATRCIPKTLSQ